MNEKFLIKKIEDKRDELNNLVSSKPTLTSYEVVKCSKELDELLNFLDNVQSLN